MPYLKKDKRAELVAAALETTDDLNDAISFMANQMIRDGHELLDIRAAIIDAAIALNARLPQDTEAEVTGPIIIYTRPDAPCPQQELVR